MDEVASKVYVQTDSQSRIIRCEGGYTTPAELTGWVNGALPNCNMNLADK